MIAIGVVAALIATILVLGSSLFGSSAARSMAGAATLAPRALGAGDVYSMSSTAIKGISGTGGTGSIELQSFSFDVGGPVTPTASGVFVGRRVHRPITIIREIDATSPLLFQAGAAGTPLGTVNIYVQPTGGAVGYSAVIT